MVDEDNDDVPAGVEGETSDATIQVDGSYGTNGQVITSDGSFVHWANGDLIPSVVISAAPPENAANGILWLNTTEGIIYTRHSARWIEY